MSLEVARQKEEKTLPALVSIAQNTNEEWMSNDNKLFFLLL